MPIFNPKTIKKHLDNQSYEINPEHSSVIHNWIANIQNGTLSKLNEIELHSSFTQQIMGKLLGYVAVGEGDTYTVAREYPVARGKVDLALGTFCGDKKKDKVVAPFELKGAKTVNLDAIMPGRHKTPVQQAFDYARDIKGAKWVLLSNYIELRLYAVSETSLVYEKFLIENLTNPLEYAKFQLLLNSKNFLTSKTEELLKESETEDKNISNKLYADYKVLREKMVFHLIKDNTEFSPENLVAPAQKILDRILFISFAEDKGLIPDTSIKKAFEHNDPYNPRPIYKNFIGLFDSVDRGNSQLGIPAYNGGLFAKDKFLDSLRVSDTLCEGFKELAEYDFDSEVSVTVLGRIFEQSIADLETLTNSIASGEIPSDPIKARSVTGKRKQDGVVYTPDNITQFIVESTLGAHLNEEFDELFQEYGKYKADGSIQWKRSSKMELKFWYAWHSKLNSIKVVDPACGSGAFLVAAFDYLLLEYEKTNEKIADLTGQRGVFDLNKEILNNNLYGVDKNAESIEITKLSLWLKTASRGKPLESLDGNFSVGNSLGISHPAPESSFSWYQQFPEVFQNGGFDVVLGNPPYVRMEALKSIKPWLEKNYKVSSDRLDLYGYFFELGVSILKKGGRLGFISNATFFKTGSGRNLRRYLAELTVIEKLIDFGDLQIFDGVTTYPAILVLKNESVATSHKIKSLSLKTKLPDNFSFALTTEGSSINQSQLSDDGWSFEDQSVLKIRKKLTHDRKSLKQIYGSPQAGIKTGFNDAFIIDEDKKNQLIQLEPLLSKLIKPILFGRDAEKWYVKAASKWVIYIPKKFKDLEQYPEIQKHLSQHRAKLEKRAAKQEWYELQQAQESYLNDFEAEKILYTDISDEPQFSLDRSGSIIDMTCFSIPTGDKFLLGLLNSNVFWFFITSIATFVRGGFYRVKNQFVEQFPIPEAEKDDKDEIIQIVLSIDKLTHQRVSNENSFKRRLLELISTAPLIAPKLNKNLENWWDLDFFELQKELKKKFKISIPLMERNEWEVFFNLEKNKRSQIEAETNQLEHLLNNKVYKLYNLNHEEIKIIESSS